MNAPVPTQTSVAEMRQGASANALAQQNYSADLMTVQGFQLAQRIAQAFASSNAVPAHFRTHVEKKSGRDTVVVENPSALGNCLVAIETAKAVGMPVSAVMQNADVIEGRLRWSGKFQIAAINASGRFTQLRFRFTKKGRVVAKYTEKQGWNKEKGGYDFVEREVTIDDVECVAWAYPIVNGVADTNDPIHGPAVSIKMAVEQGWYSKPGSKWHGEMQELMLHYRAGSFFGNVHAPDIVMGMGRTSEEEYDILDMDAAGNVTQMTRSRQPAATKRADVVEAEQPTPAPAPAPKPTVAAQPAPPEPAPRAEPAAAPAPQKAPAPAFDVHTFTARLERCNDIEALHLLADEIRSVGDEEAEGRLYAVYRRRERDLTPKYEPHESASAPPPQPAATTRNRTQRTID